MSENPYERFRSDELTALAFAIAGAGTIKFLGSPGALFLGWCLVVVASGVAGMGLWRYRTVAARISASRKPAS